MSLSRPGCSCGISRVAAELRVVGVGAGVAGAEVRPLAEDPRCC